MALRDMAGRSDHVGFGRMRIVPTWEVIEVFRGALLWLAQASSSPECRRPPLVPGAQDDPTARDPPD